MARSQFVHICFKVCFQNQQFFFTFSLYTVTITSCLLFHIFHKWADMQHQLSSLFYICKCGKRITPRQSGPFFMFGSSAIALLPHVFLGLQKANRPGKHACRAVSFRKRFTITPRR